MLRRALVAAILLTIPLAGCGGGSSPAVAPGAGPIRPVFLHESIARLEIEGASAKAIACVERNIDAATEEQIARRVLEGAPAEKVESESEVESLGPFGKSCF